MPRADRWVTGILLFLRRVTVNHYSFSGGGLLQTILLLVDFPIDAFNEVFFFLIVVAVFLIFAFFASYFLDQSSDLWVPSSQVRWPLAGTVCPAWIPAHGSPFQCLHWRSETRKKEQRHKPTICVSKHFQPCEIPAAAPQPGRSTCDPRLVWFPESRPETGDAPCDLWDLGVK